MNIDDRRLVFFGTSDFARISLHHLIEADYRPELVVTQPDAPKRRSATPTPSPVGAYALEQGLSLHRPADVNTEDSLEALRETAAPLFVVVAYGQKLGADLLDIPRLGTFNVHASLLPKYRGAAPIHKAILEGDEVTGISLIDLVEKMDAGDVIATRELRIGENETAGQLHDRLAELGGELLVETLPEIFDGRIERIPQDPSRVSWAKRFRKSDGHLDFDQSADRVIRFIRAMNPWPGAFVTWKSKSGEERLVLLEARRIQESTRCQLPEHEGAPGEVVRSGQRLFVNTMDGPVEILLLQRSGKKALESEEFLRGARMETGDLLV